MAGDIDIRCTFFTVLFWLWNEKGQVAHLPLTEFPYRPIIPEWYKHSFFNYSLHKGQFQVNLFQQYQDSLVDADFLLNDRLVFYAALNSISVTSWWQLTLFMPFLGLWSVLPKDTPQKTQRTPGLWVKHFTTQDPKDFLWNLNLEKGAKMMKLAKNTFILTFLVVQAYSFQS